MYNVSFNGLCSRYRFSHKYRINELNTSLSQSENSSLTQFHKWLTITVKFSYFRKHFHSKTKHCTALIETNNSILMMNWIPCFKSITKHFWNFRNTQFHSRLAFHCPFNKCFIHLHETIFMEMTALDIFRIFYFNLKRKSFHSSTQVLKKHV